MPDAIAMAVRFDCPIYTFEFIMDSAGVELEDGDDDQTITRGRTRSTDTKKKSVGITSMSEDELQSSLDEALAKEDYEAAAKIRDEMIKRKSEES